MVWGEGGWGGGCHHYCARHFVRRLWSEEVHDAVAQSSGTFPIYTIANFTDQGFAKPSYAMQLPDVTGLGIDGNANNLMDSFFRGNRDDQYRRQDGSILQALNLMDNVFVHNLTHATGAHST